MQCAIQFSFSGSDAQCSAVFLELAVCDKLEKEEGLLKKQTNGALDCPATA